MRVATIDVGTNTVLLLVAERRGDGPPRTLAERAEITRLGEGVDQSRRLAPHAVERTRDCLARYAAEIRERGVDRIAVVGTSAMRDAAGGESLLRSVRDLFGVDVRVLSGEEEARLTFRGALRGMAGASGETAAVFDIGGGSTEVIIGRLEGAVLHSEFVESFDVGSVRLTERHIRHDPPLPDELDAVRDALTAAFARLPALRGGIVPIGVAGTVTTLASVSMSMETYDGARLHGHILPATELRSVVSRLAACDLQTRRRTVGLEPKRADVIVAGGTIALALLERWAAPVMVVSDGGVRWGLAEELLGL